MHFLHPRAFANVKHSGRRGEIYLFIVTVCACVKATAFFVGGIGGSSPLLPPSVDRIEMFYISD